MEQEVWIDIEGYEGIYMVSSYGRVKSLTRIDSGGHKRNGAVLKESNSRHGYSSVWLCKFGISELHLVHRLVAINFLDNHNSYPVVNHKNGIKSDNRLENLEWCTYSYNSKHAFNTLGRKPTKPNIGRFSDLNYHSKPIIQLSKDGIQIREFACAMDAKRELGVNNTKICEVLKGTRKHAGGFKWKYKQPTKEKEV